MSVLLINFTQNIVWKMVTLPPSSEARPRNCIHLLLGLLPFFRSSDTFPTGYLAKVVVERKTRSSPSHLTAATRRRVLKSLGRQAWSTQDFIHVNNGARASQQILYSRSRKHHRKPPACYRLQTIAALRTFVVRFTFFSAIIPCGSTKTINKNFFENNSPMPYRKQGSEWAVPPRPNSLA